MLALIIVGFVMMTIGVALICLGEVPFVSGKRIPALRSRLIGVVLVSFLPLAWGARQATIALFGPDTVQGPVVTWSLFGLCWFVTLVILFRVMVPKRERRASATATTTASTKNPFGGREEFDLVGESGTIEPIEAAPKASKKTPAKKAEPAPVRKTPAKKPGKPSMESKDPFDFS